MKTHSVKLTNGEVINDVVEVQFSACGQPMLQIDITDHATRFGIDELIKFYKGKIDHIYVWHRCNGQLCHTKVFGYESDLFDSQLDDIAKEIERAYPQNTLTITLNASDESELFYAFKNRGSSPTKRKVAKFLRALDVEKGRSTPPEYWYAK